MKASWAEDTKYSLKVMDQLTLAAVKISKVPQIAFDTLFFMYLKAFVRCVSAL